MAHRLLGSRANDVKFQIHPQAATDRYTVDARGGRVRVQASSPSAAGRGLYDYLRRGPGGGAPGSVVNWDGSQLNIGSKWWDAHLEGSSPAKWRHYFNVCTFGYTTAFWSWSDWEKELDWMSLHGINFPLAMVGQEAVWQRVWRKHGLSDSEIRSFFSGPAFLPWHRMGNINTHAGPLPQSWIDNQALLQKRILGRMRELGLKPVLPAFSGFLPPVYSAKHPELKTRKSTAWAGFEPTILLDPRDPSFKQIGKEFIDTYREMFGVDGYYLADVFNEMTPQVGPATKLDDLRETAKGVYEAIKAGDPNGVWVTQGWLFYNESAFWHEPEIAAYLSGVPKDKIVLLDLFCDNTEIWRRSQAFRDRPYIWNMLHNFGGQTALFGDMQGLVAKVEKLEGDPDKGGFVGMGLTMEGIHQNPAMYELMTDLMWSQPKAASAWYEDYLASRWGSETAAHELAEPMRKVFYGGLGGRTMSYQHRPTLAGPDETTPLPGALPLAKRMFEYKELFDHPLFKKDLIDVAKQVAGDAIGVELSNAFEDVSAGRPGGTPKVFSLMSTLDSLLEEVPHYRLTDWVNGAKRTVPPRDSALLGRNARLQVTQWGGPVLFEYAAKEWSGLLREYYLPRWMMLLDSLRRGEKDDLAFEQKVLKFEADWIEMGSRSQPTVHPLGWQDGLKTILVEAARAKPQAEAEPGIAVGKLATDSGGTEPGGGPEKAVDGRVAGGWWAASPYPQWWQVDLGLATSVDRIQIFTYYGDSRYYRYDVQVSLDGTNWTKVADMSQNEKPSDRRGFEHRFPSRAVRFVRVNMLFNSANVGVHLREVRVFGPKG